MRISPTDISRISRSAPLTLHLVRHGRTVYNDQARLQGWCDSPLTDTGRAGVLSTARYLAEVPFVAAWTSPSGRTRTTSELILATHPGVTPTAHDGLREFSFGDYEARPEPELYDRIPTHELYGGVLTGTFPGLPGGESGRTYLGRVAAAFAEIERAHPDGGDVLVVSHGVTLLAYLAMVVTDAPLRPLANASVSTVRIDENGVRTALLVGHDPAGTAMGQPDLPFTTDRVGFEEAASWAAADTVTD